jgi:Big-like domain-containing protein/filamin/ABP280 repeat protein
MHLLRRSVVSVMLLALGACGGGDLTLPSEGQPAQIKALSGDDQTGTILEPAQDSLVVRVTDPFGSPVAGVEIAWAATGGGAVQPASVVTGADGRAATQRVLGDQPGEYGTTAATTMLPDAVVTFTTTAVAAKLVLVTQPAAATSSGAVIAPGPVIQLQDASGNSLARDGVSVTAQIASGQGSLRGTTSRSTDANGQVAFDDLAIVGGPGARTLIFAAPGYAPAVSTPVSLGVGAPATVTIAAGDGQTATGGTALPIKPAVVVRDAGGTPVAGLAVTFAVASGGGSIEGGSATTGADGVATAGRWTLGAVAGPNTLQATVGAEGVSGNPVTFTATAVVGAPSPDKSTVSATPGTIAASQGSAPSTITVTVRDAAGNPLAGQPVSLAATGAGVSLAQPGPTDGSGTTTAAFSATGAGPHTITAATGSITLGSTTVTVTPGAPDPSRVSVSVPSGTAGSATQVQMTLQDQFGNPVVGAAGQISVVVSGANAKGNLPIVEQGGGRYSATYTPVRVGTDQVDVRVGGTPVPGSPFASAVAAGAPDPNHTIADVPDGTVAQQIEIIVHVRDGQDNPVGRGGDHVTVTAAGIGLAVQDRGDGTYRAVWSVFLPGKYPVVITLNGAPIKGSPYSTHIKF